MTSATMFLSLDKAPWEEEAEEEEEEEEVKKTTKHYQEVFAL